MIDNCCFVFFFKYQIHSLNQPAIKHNVKSLITSPNKLPHSMPQLEAMERVKYEENKPVRHTSVVNSTTSVLRSTHQEAGRAQHSPGMYEDSNSRRTPVNYTNPVSRGSPMLGRASDGNFHKLTELRVLIWIKDNHQQSSQRYNDSTISILIV